MSSPKTNPRSPEEEGYFLAADKRCRETVNVPVIAVGGFRSPEGCERALQMGAADFIALSRPLVREPDLVGRWAQGDERRAKCISCNLCRRELMQGDMPYLMCVLEKRMEGRT